MNALLHVKQAALRGARAAQQAALAATRARSRALQQRDRAYPRPAGGGRGRPGGGRRAAAQAASASSRLEFVGLGSSTCSCGPALGRRAVGRSRTRSCSCESGGQNLPPNSAGASGYYQIMPGTWTQYGGTGPAAYLASKAEQDAVAAGSGTVAPARRLGLRRDRRDHLIAQF